MLVLICLFIDSILDNLDVTDSDAKKKIPNISFTLPPVLN
jgi:hypothetical protein